MMRCDAVEPLMHRCFDGEGTPDDQAAVEAHCAACATCARARRDLEETRALLRSVLRAPPGARLRADLDRRLGSAEESARFWEETGRFASRWTRIAAAITVVCGGAGALSLRGGERDTPRDVVVAAQAGDLLLARGPITTDRAAQIVLAGVAR